MTEKQLEYHRKWRIAHPKTEAQRKTDRERGRAIYKRNAEKIKAYQKAYNAQNKDKVRNRQKAWADKNRERISAQRRAFRQANKDRILAKQHSSYIAHRDERRKKAAEYQKKNRAKRRAYLDANRQAINLAAREYRRARRAIDPDFKLRENLRTRIYQVLKNSNAKKAKKTTELIGCSVDFLRGYLEARFTLGMTWANYGEWNLDHRIPCAEFDLTDPEQQRQCFHYSNLQPLWAVDNFVKNCRPPAPHQAELI